MEKKKIRTSFDFRVVELLKIIVPDQKMKLDDGEGNHWESYAVDCEGMAIAIIKRNEEEVAKVVYDYETGKEETFLY